MFLSTLNIYISKNKYKIQLQLIRYIIMMRLQHYVDNPLCHHLKIYFQIFFDNQNHHQIFFEKTEFSNK